MLIEKTFKIDLFCAKIKVIFTDDLLKEALKYTIPEQIGNINNADALTFGFMGSPIIILPINVTHLLIQHELFHAIDSVLSNRGIKLIDGSEEVYAYMTGYLSEQIYKFISKNESIILKSF